ncbi:hypothetical protein [Nonomuraea basaltis]|uniref:hypothetical protein n=1 Tax=Nonomuraea basaltis TaxID=2495887 RepID=UPI00110C40DB|nr:hypothetical protein [Nonomuraea basaltis]TMR87878.1 hypothetical protein EJK15_69380 [Nonomuraea basaltis]
MSNSAAKAAFNRTRCYGAKTWIFRGYVKHRTDVLTGFTHAQLRMHVYKTNNVAYTKYVNTKSLKDFRFTIKMKYLTVRVDVRGYRKTWLGNEYGKWSSSETVHR